jgi:hypothetical protein
MNFTENNTNFLSSPVSEKNFVHSPFTFPCMCTTSGWRVCYKSHACVRLQAEEYAINLMHVCDFRLKSMLSISCVCTTSGWRVYYQSHACVRRQAVVYTINLMHVYDFRL